MINLSKYLTINFKKNILLLSYNLCVSLLTYDYRSAFIRHQGIRHLKCFKLEHIAMIDHPFGKSINHINSPKLLIFFRSNRRSIFSYLRKNLSIKPATNYKSFLLSDPEGQRRMSVYMNSFESALTGDMKTFLKDQKLIGYKRAMEGYHLNDVYGYTVAFKDALWEAIRLHNSDTKRNCECLNNEDIFALNNLLDSAYYFLSLSFIETRDEIIKRNREQLQIFQKVLASVVTVFEEKKVWTAAAQGVFDVFGFSGTLLIKDSSTKRSISTTPTIIGSCLLYKELQLIWEVINNSKKFVAIDLNDKIIRLSDYVEIDNFRFIASPLFNHQSKLLGAICVHDNGKLFQFSRFDRNLFSQFSYFIGAISSNSKMVSELAEKQIELKNIATRLISIQEEERKKIAADIHDVLTQALSGIGYKALYCIEIIEKKPKYLESELEQLIEYINDALHQSREIISNLRPHILDDIGMIPAFKKFIREFDKKFDFKINFSFPEPFHIDSEKAIALFRILQEALYNIQRHSFATKINVSLRIHKNSILRMIISDNGKGFTFLQQQHFKPNSGLGLLTMRERAENLGGDFRIASCPGNGSNIIVKVPLEKTING